MDLEREYFTYFSEFFENVKEQFRKSVGLKEVDELSSGELAFRDAISSLPCPVSIIRLKIDITKHEKAKNNVYHLIRYDFSNFGESSIKYYGEIDLDEIEKDVELLKDFNIDKQKIEWLRDFKTPVYGDLNPWYGVWIIPYDILENAEEYARDFLYHPVNSFLMIFENKILQKFERKIDYNSKYGLKNDPVLPLSEIVKKDKIFSSFVKVDKHGKSREITIEDLQKAICGIQLIPNVPEEVKKVFNAAKRLRIFGYFEYYFFTISEHYAFLALESALRNRYNEIYDKQPYLFSWDDIPGNDSNRLIDSLEKLLKINWVRKAEIIKSDDNQIITVKKKRNSLELKLNKEKKKVVITKFTNCGKTYECLLKEEDGKLIVYDKPSNNLKVIIQKLVKKGIIPKREEKIYDNGRKFRGDFSHPTKPPIRPISSDTLERVAYQINQIYNRGNEEIN